MKIAEDYICEAIRRNGGTCFRDLLEEMSEKEALEEIKNQIENFKMIGKTGWLIANLLELSVEVRKADKLSLSELILLFDKIIHAEHATGAFKEFLSEEKSIFNVDIRKIKEEADKEVLKILYNKIH